MSSWNVTDIGSVVEQVRGERVSESVGSHLAQSRTTRSLLENFRDAGPSERVRVFTNVPLIRIRNKPLKLFPPSGSAQRRWPERNASRPWNPRSVPIVQPVPAPIRPVPRNAALLHQILTLEEIACLAAPQVLPKPSPSSNPEEDSPVPTLTAHQDRPPCKINVLQADAHELAEPTTRRVEQLQNRAVPWIRRSSYQPPYICLRERPQQPSSFGPRPYESRRNLIDNTTETEIVEKRSQSPQVSANNLARQIADRRLGYELLNVMGPNPREALSPPVPQKLFGYRSYASRAPREYR
jgi:hypothetical protein